MHDVVVKKGKEKGGEGGRGKGRKGEGKREGRGREGPPLLFGQIEPWSLVHYVVCCLMCHPVYLSAKQHTFGLLYIYQ